MKRPKLRQLHNRALMLISVIVSSGLAWTTGNIAAQHTKGMIRDGMYQLAVDGTTLLCWMVFGVCFLFVLAAVWALVLSLTSRREVLVSKSPSLASTQRFHSYLSPSAMRK